ncbi:MAG: FAD-dependent oxidoreductase [Gammaproteobacteria bacterium]|nr:FAD-dependent oxidoreductase [Gammaproteobacteria bacterium]
MTRIAIVGAGIAGLVAAKELARHAEVTVFEKSRGVGGRMATRRAGQGGEVLQFDHGAQFFTARSDAFRQFLRPLIDIGVVGCWNARFAEMNRGAQQRGWQWSDAKPHYVGVPGMSAVGNALAQGVEVCLNTTISKIEKQGDLWHLRDESGEKLGDFDWVVLGAPASQTASLLPDLRELMAATNVSMLPCFAMMLGFQEPLKVDWQAARVLNADISWISVDSSKPGRPGNYCLVVHSTNAWAEENLDLNPELVTGHLLAEASETLGVDTRAATHIQLHRWRYANLARRSDEVSLVDAAERLAVCGDWLVHGRVEAAFLSARRMLERLVPLLSA